MLRPAKPIICPACHKDSGHKQGPMLMVIRPPGLKCQHCEHVVLRAPEYELRQAPNYRVQSTGAHIGRRGC